MKAVTIIQYCRRIFLLVLCLAFARTSMAGISIFVNKDPLALSQLSARYYFDTSGQHSIGRYFQVKTQMKEFPSSNLDMSYVDGMYWISIELSHLPGKELFNYMQFNNPHINYLGAWIMKGDSVIREFHLTGDHMPFDSRNVHHPHFVYRLSDEHKSGTLLLLIDKRNEQLHVPLHFFTTNQFLRNNRINSMFTGLMSGISIFIFLFTIFLYFNIREKLYIYYAIYVLMVAGYIFSDLGLSFMLFYPNYPAFADFARPITVSLSPACYILFARSLLDVKKNFPGIYRFTNYYLVFFVLTFLLAFLVIPNTGAMRVFWLVFMQVLMFVSIIPVLVFSIAGWKKGVKYSGYVTIASVIYTFSTQLYMQYITGNTVENFITENAVNLGFSIEISLLALALSIRFKNYKLEAEKLLRKLNLQQENIFRNISEYQEKEMLRVSALLHDSVGAGLSSIKYNLEAIKNGNNNKSTILHGTINDVSLLADEIRNISHNLSPLLLQKKGLITALRDLTEQYNRTGMTQVHLESIGSLNHASFQNELLVFRILQELLHNAIKHAKATEIILQIIIEPELISIFVEDNGRGFDKNSVNEGLGFSQINGLVTFVNGRFEVDSQVNKGCRISIEFPTIPHESTDKSVAGR